MTDRTLSVGFVTVACYLCPAVTLYYRKPRVYWTYYPKMRRGYWRVSPRPARANEIEHVLWREANRAVTVVNDGITYDILAAEGVACNGK